jgi:hypothetical protein
VLATILGAVGGIVALGTLYYAGLEYRRRGRQQRAENLLRMMERYLSDERFLQICDLLDARDEDRLSDLKWGSKRVFLGFVEEVALLVNSKLIPREIAYYMLAYYPLRARESGAFMAEVDPDSQYWQVFNEFTREMEQLEAVPPDLKAFRF